jgi:hypothetical protein
MRHFTDAELHCSVLRDRNLPEPTDSESLTEEVLQQILDHIKICCECQDRYAKFERSETLKASEIAEREEYDRRIAGITPERLEEIRQAYQERRNRQNPDTK